MGGLKRTGGSIGYSYLPGPEQVDREIEYHSLTLLAKLKDGVYVWPLFGAVTDVHIWGRALNEKEVREWEQCEKEGCGDIVDWENIQLDSLGLDMIDMDKK